MKIELIKLKFSDTHSYKYKPFTHCCDKIQNDKAIIFTGEDLVHSDDCWDDIGTAISIWSISHSAQAPRYIHIRQSFIHSSPFNSSMAAALSRRCQYTRPRRP